MIYEILSQRLTENFERELASRTLFEVEIDKDKLWDIYLESIPDQFNPIYRVRRTHDCSCCRHFIKSIGGTVWIDENYIPHSIFDFDAGSDVFQPVMDAMAAYVKSCPITDVYASRFSTVGTGSSHERNEDGSITTYKHFAVNLPRHLLYMGGSTIETYKSHIRDTRSVFKRSLEEISMEAINSVIELIKSNTLYKGSEWAEPLGKLKRYKEEYEALPAEIKNYYCWAMATTVGMTLGRIRNHSIGVLLTEISAGTELDGAVRHYERIVAPANYKRPKAIFTKKMLEDAQRTVTELGYMDSLPRRFATLDDITVNNILFSNRDAARRISGSVFDEMAAEAVTRPKKFSRAEDIPAEKFVSDILPTATEVEAFIENRHEANMVSLIAPENKTAKTMFKWDNGFSWAYTGNMTDSDIRENVKSAGGRVDGVLRFSIQWNDISHDGNDLDAHCKEPSYEIFYGAKISPHTKGNLDVDIIHTKPGNPAVENITYPSKSDMNLGTYDFFVHCYSCRGGTSGFRAEIEFDGQVYRYDYRKPLRQEENVRVASVTLDKNGSFTIKEELPSETTSREIWGVKTNQFVPVSVVMFSPNYWDEQQGIGHKHYMFILKDCKNPETPNGFYNEFLKNELVNHKRVFEALGSKMAVSYIDDQLSGLGFSSTKRNDLIVKVKGSTERILKIKF